MWLNGQICILQQRLAFDQLTSETSNEPVRWIHHLKKNGGSGSMEDGDAISSVVDDKEEILDRAQAQGQPWLSPLLHSLVSKIHST